MPWKRAKALPPPDNSLFEACFRIQREAEAAAGHTIPMVVENVLGAQKWVGRARWHYGSFYLWGDVPALMPITRTAIKVPTMGAGWYPPDHPKHVSGLSFNGHSTRNLKRRTNKGNGVRFTSRDCGTEASGIKQGGGDWFNSTEPSISRLTGSKSSARKHASAHIAKIPLPLAQHIARAWYPCA